MALSISLNVHFTIIWEEYSRLYFAPPPRANNAMVELGWGWGSGQVTWPDAHTNVIICIFYTGNSKSARYQPLHPHPRFFLSYIQLIKEVWFPPDDGLSAINQFIICDRVAPKSKYSYKLGVFRSDPHPYPPHTHNLQRPSRVQSVGFSVKQVSLSANRGWIDVVNEQTAIAPRRPKFIITYVQSVRKGFSESQLHHRLQFWT